jgi:hypothetical protein
VDFILILYKGMMQLIHWLFKYPKRHYYYLYGLFSYDHLSYVIDEYTRTNKKHSHEEYEMVCKGYSYHFWKTILKTTYTHYFWINKWQSTKHLRSWSGMFNSIDAFSMETNSSGMKWTIFRQRWQLVKYFGSSSRPISLDLAYILHITIIY